MLQWLDVPLGRARFGATACTGITAYRPQYHPSCKDRMHKLAEMKLRWQAMICQKRTHRDFSSIGALSERKGKQVIAHHVKSLPY